MIKSIALLGIVMMSCGAAKTSQTNVSADSTAKAPQMEMTKDSIPSCIRAKIDSFKKLEPQQQPQAVVEFTYKGKKVYYISMPCCDFFNEVYDAECKLLGAPDGGFTGRGDGKLPGFSKEATDRKLIWEPKRK